mgnify:CR=1 FL=1
MKVALSTLLHGCDSWALPPRQVRRLEKFQQTYLWGILRIKWDDFVSNALALRKANGKLVEILLEKIKLALHMDESQLPKVTLNGELAYCAGTSRWQRIRHHKDQLNDLLKKSRLRANWTELAKDRAQWKQNYNESPLSIRKRTKSAPDPTE